MVKYSRGYTPLCLVEKALDAHNENCRERKYTDSNSRYKCKFTKKSVDYYPIRDALKAIYRNKCAYCETRFNRSYIKIEHYRPKSIYYALAYSWSNLLPICDKCNTKKSDNFSIYGRKIIHNNRALEKMQYATRVYNRIEQPLFIHPEIDDYSNIFRFNTQGEMLVYDSISMNYTIRYSYLNELELMERRATVLEDFIKIRDELFYLFRMAKKHQDKEELNEFKKCTIEKMELFFNDENEFIAVRKFIIKRLRFYLLKYDVRFVKFFRRYLKEYIKDIEVYA